MRNVSKANADRLDAYLERMDEYVDLSEQEMAEKLAADARERQASRDAIKNLRLVLTCQGCGTVLRSVAQKLVNGSPRAQRTLFEQAVKAHANEKCAEAQATYTRVSV